MRDFEGMYDIPKADINLRYEDEYNPSGDGVKERKPISLWSKILVGILIFALLLSTVYALMHPLDKLKLKLLLFDNYTIEISTYSYYDTKHVIHVDGNYMQIDSDIYEYDNGRLYIYQKVYGGKWDKELVSSSDEISDNYDLGVELMKKSNYHRAKNSLFAWELNSSVRKEFEISNPVTLKRAFGKISIVIENGIYDVYLSFSGFGRTEVTLPWES